MHEISSQSRYCSEDMLNVHFELGDASIIDSMSIEWPSGIIDQ
ncbi:MAG: ASPIC/UnbV domain-containing protein [Chitinophagales bacterium]|nr:ASPIC/UnbV domain-containing protein [Chitinophagales bacterium]